MEYSMRYRNRFLKVLSMVFYDYPVPINLNIFWNFGSLLGVCLVIQIITGLLLACHYTPEVTLAFKSVIHIMRDVNNGWFLRSMHANGASFFFICIYIHIGRGIYYHCFCSKRVWWVGCHMYILLMAIAFTGYVLPWSQMSYWGATVITNMFGAIPYVGQSVMEWVWGGYSVCDATLKRFFVFHFLSPFILVILVCIHIMFLHDVGSSNPMGIDSDAEAVPFHVYYTLKDLVGINIMVTALVLVCLVEPDLFMHPDHFIPADPLKTPLHIQPEWYFLFAYTMLRSIPHKLGGVLVMVSSVLILYLLPFYPTPLWRGLRWNPLGQVYFWFLVGDFIVLSFIGTCPVEPPFDLVGVGATLFYFFFFASYPITWFFWESLVFDYRETSLKQKPLEFESPTWESENSDDEHLERHEALMRHHKAFPDSKPFFLIRVDRKKPYM